MLFEIYQRLLNTFPKDCENLYGEAIENTDAIWLAVGSEGYPHLMFPVSGITDESDLKFRFIDVQFSRECYISDTSSNDQSGSFTLIKLKDDDPDVIRVFLRLLEETFFNASENLDNRFIRKEVLHLIELFSKITFDKSNLIGLWGELFTISNAADIEKAVSCWCSSENAKYDFVTRDFMLEVKTSLKSSRLHSFSLEQLRPSTDANVYIASILIAEVPSGLLLSQLIDQISASISDLDERRAFFRLCILKGGKDIYRLTMKLKPIDTGISIAIYESAQIPVPYIDPADPISHLRFDVNLTDIIQITANDRDRVLLF
jgi:hypothetical protein